MLPLSFSLPPERRMLVLPGFVSGHGVGTGRITGDQALTAFLSPLGHPAVDSWGCSFGGCHCCALFYFFPQLSSKSRALGEGKENPM